MQTAKLMTNIMPQLYSFIEKEAKRSKRSKREVVEEAVELLMKKILKDHIMEQYASIENDIEYQNEMREMAEMGMGTYLEELDNADK